MRHLFVFLLTFSSFLLMAQMPKKWDQRDSTIAEYHSSKPLPFIQDEPVFELSNEVRGWSWSQDEQWLTDYQKIPLNGVSSVSKTLNEWSVGMDNIDKLAFYQLVHGEDTFLVYVKVFRTGSYKYPTTRKGWRTQKDLYWATFRKPIKTRPISELLPDSNYYFSFPLYGEGYIRDLTGWQALHKRLEKEIYPEPQDRNFVLQMERKMNDQLQFLAYSIHPIFDDPEGLVSDFKVKNKSIFGVKETLFRCHYSILTTEWTEWVLP